MPTVRSNSDSNSNYHLPSPTPAPPTSFDSNTAKSILTGIPTFRRRHPSAVKPRNCYHPFSTTHLPTNSQSSQLRLQYDLLNHCPALTSTSYSSNAYSIPTCTHLSVDDTLQSGYFSQTYLRRSLGAKLKLVFFFICPFGLSLSSPTS